MPRNTTHPAGRGTSVRRAQVLAEAVVSAYIHELSSPRRPRQRARVHYSRTEPSSRTVTRSRLAHERGHALARRRRAAIELGA